MKQFFITTAIDYANGSPHLGHAYEKVLADVIARTQRLRGKPVHFLTGLDEHGQKVQQSAQARQIAPQALCDQVAEEFKTLLQTLHISNDDYLRTTEPRHQQAVCAVLQKLFDQGDIYLGEYRGFYSARQEQFLLEKDKVNGHWPEIYGEVVEVVEKNYFFKLAQHQDWLRDFLRSNPDWIFPAYRQKQVVEFLKEPLNDLCISRPRERLAWGIPLPFDDKFVTYVWFDALVNYISAVGCGTPEFSQNWPADVHVIGKDILVPAHAVYWPIMLKAIGLPLPRQLLVHGFWTSGGKKESKTDIEKAKAAGERRFNPLDVITSHGADPFRYYVMREMILGQDSEFTKESFTARYNSELADDFGNLVSRLLNMGARYTQGYVPVYHADVCDQEEFHLQTNWKELALKIENLSGLLGGNHSIPSSLHFTGIDTFLREINIYVKSLNAYIEKRAPWKLAKSNDPKDRLRLETGLAVVAEGVRLVAAAYTPIMPEVSTRILGLLGHEPIEQWAGSLDWDNRLAGMAKLGEKVILFPKIEAQKAGI